MNFLRGWIGELKTRFIIWLFLKKDKYYRFHNIILPSKNGTAQLDHLIISVHGIFIVETKNKKGWIFGSENQANWTQVIYHNKYTFQNPLFQTYRHKKVLCEFIKIPLSKVKSVVFFVGKCKFKTKMPANVMKWGLGRHIKRNKDYVFTEQEVKQIVFKIQRFRAESTLTKKDHLVSLNERHNSDTTCPKCGSSLVERQVRNGPYAGSYFLGCSNYPKCRFSKS